MDDQPIRSAPSRPITSCGLSSSRNTVAGKLVTDTHSIYSIAYDAAGNQQKSDPVTIRIAPGRPNQRLLCHWTYGGTTLRGRALAG